MARWRLTLLAAAILTVLAGLLVAGGLQVDDDAEGYAPTAQFRDEGHFVYRVLSGDGQLTARVTDQEHSHPRARAGLMVRADGRRGAPYAALVTTPEHGIQLRSDVANVEAIPDSEASWLRVERSGTRVRAHVSDDGRNWEPVGAHDVAGLEGDVQIGMVVASPDTVRVERSFTGDDVIADGTVGEAMARVTPTTVTDG